MSIICVISARGGSEGLENKNIRMLLGKPMIVWSIEQALQTPEIDEVFVSSDSEEIIQIAKEAGANAPFKRPDYLSNSTIGKFDVWKHALSECEKHVEDEINCYIDLDCTNPLRDPDDISKAIKQFKDLENEKIDAVFSICEARKNPYFNLVELDGNNNLQISKKILDGRVVRRQDAPSVFEHVASIYVLNPEFIRRKNNLLDGKSSGYDIGIDKSFDVDSELDFEIIEFLMKKKHG